MEEATMLGLLDRASFVFSGTVAEPLGSSLRVIPPRPGTAVVRLERGFVVDPALGNVEGRPITVRLAKEGAGGQEVREGERLVFFATAWVHGEEIAVVELARLPADEQTEKEVAKVVESLPERHLAARIASAEVVVHGTVRRVVKAKLPITGSEHDPFWMEASIEPQEVMKGEAAAAPRSRGRRAGLVFVFPGTMDRAFREWPRPSAGDSAVFLLHSGLGIGLPEGFLIAPDPLDVHPAQALPTIKRLLTGRNAAGPPDAHA
jgi:hypothetical protein